MSYCLLSIGCYEFIFQKTAEATKAIELLSKALQVTGQFNDSRRKVVYSPNITHPATIELTIVSEKDVDLRSLSAVPAGKPIKRTGRLLLGAPEDPRPLFVPNPYAPEK